MSKPNELRKEALSRVYALILALPVNEEADPHAANDKSRQLTVGVRKPHSELIVPEKIVCEGEP